MLLNEAFLNKNHYLCFKFKNYLIMTIVECSYPNLGLNLNPKQIFVFNNSRTKDLMPELWRYSQNQHSYEFVFIDYDPRNRIDHTVFCIDELLFQNIIRSDIVVRIMPSSCDDFRYITETVPPECDWQTLESIIKRITRRLRDEEFRSLEESLLTFMKDEDPEFVDLVDKAYNSDLSKLEEMSAEYANDKTKFGKLPRSAEFTSKFFNQIHGFLGQKVKQMMAESLGYPDRKDSILLFKSILLFDAPDGDRNGFEPIQPIPNFKIVISPAKRNVNDKDGNYDITVVDADSQHLLVFPHRGAKMLYLLSLLCQTRVDGLPTNYFTTDISQEILIKIYNKVFGYGGADWLKGWSEDSHQISVNRNHASTSIKNHWDLSDEQKYWCDLENKRVKIKSRHLQLRRTRLPNDSIVIEDNPHDDETLTSLVSQLPPLDSLFGLKRTKTGFFTQTNQNLERAGKTPKSYNYGE